MKKTLLSLTLLSSLVPFALAERFNWEDYYTVEVITLPAVDPQIGGMDLDADGNLVVCFHRGEVMRYSPEKKEWTEYASGLHEPLGLLTEDDGAVVVVQRGELTRLIDENGDGKADFYKNLSDDWGMSGNYHEFTFGLARDSKKNYYIALGTASNGAGVREEVRGEWNDNGGLTQEKFLPKDGNEWKEMKKLTPRMYSRVPYRGCVLRITPDSRKAEVYATGFRTPNGLYMDEKDQLWINDNQGDWVGASRLARVVEGGFHGHAASLLWTENPPSVVPAEVPPEELNKFRVKGAALMPQGDCANSTTQPFPAKSSFTSLKEEGPLLMGDMNSSRLPLYYPEEVNGQIQGATTHFMVTSALNQGNNRFVYTPDGKSLYVGKTHLSWPGAEGLYKITYNGKPYFQVQQFKLHPKGFEIFFNDTIRNSKRLKEYTIRSYEKLYHKHYGSPKHKPAEEKVVHVENRGRSILVELENPPKANRVYDITLPKSIESDLGILSCSRYWYTAHEVYESAAE